jgi:hypothetical protein
MDEDWDLVGIRDLRGAVDCFWPGSAAAWAGCAADLSAPSASDRKNSDL